MLMMHWESFVTVPTALTLQNTIGNEAWRLENRMRGSPQACETHLCEMRARTPAG